MEGNLLVSIFDENQLRTIVEDAVRKIMLELKEDNSPQPDEWLDSKQVCQLLKISKSSLVNYRKRNLITSHKLQGKLLFRYEEILPKIKKLRQFRSVEDSVI